MRFKKGDIVICTGFDNLRINYSLSFIDIGINVLTYFGYIKDQQMIVSDIFEDLLIFYNLNGKVSLCEDYFEKLSIIRERKLLKLLKLLNDGY